MPNQLLGVQLDTIATSGLSRVRTEFVQLLVIPSLTPYPVQANGQSAGHGDLGDLPSPTQRQVKILTAPFRIAPHKEACAWYLGGGKTPLGKPPFVPRKRSRR